MAPTIGGLLCRGTPVGALSAIGSTWLTSTITILKKIITSFLLRKTRKPSGHRHTRRAFRAILLFEDLFPRRSPHDRPHCARKCNSYSVQYLESFGGSRIALLIWEVEAELPRLYQLLTRGVVLLSEGAVGRGSK